MVANYEKCSTLREVIVQIYVIMSHTEIIGCNLSIAALLSPLTIIPSYHMDRFSESSQLPEFIMDREGRLLDADGFFVDDIRSLSQNPVCPSDPLRPLHRLPLRDIDRAARKLWIEKVILTLQEEIFSISDNEYSWKCSISPVYSCNGNIPHFLLKLKETGTVTVQAQKNSNTLAAFTELYDAIPASIIIVDAEMRLIGWNRYSRDTINGLSDNEMQGVNPLRRVHPDDLPEISRKLKNIINSDAEETGEFRMFHKDGPPYKWATFRGKKAVIENREYIVCVVTEMTEIRLAREKQKMLEEQLFQYQKMELLGQLAGGIAHDFNNTLSAIIGNTELLLDKLEPDSLFASGLGDIHKLALRSAELTRKLLAFARKQVTMPIVLRLGDAVSECIHLHRTLFDENVHIVFYPCREALTVKLDPVQLDQILTNLLINARDAISGDGTIRVECRHVHFDSTQCVNRHSGLQPGDYALLSVSDTGRGIDTATLPHIFEPFFTTKEIGKGTGMGLSTVYGIVMQNSGHIECRSEPGKGTTFDILLPTLPDTHQPDDVSPQTTECDRNCKKTIMVVEDEPYILKLISDILESQNFTVLTARDAEECLRYTADPDCRIDLVISDVVLPNMNGIEMSRLLQERNPEIKLLFMSAYAPDHICHYRKLKERVNFIQKPFGIDDFLSAISLVMNPESILVQEPQGQ
jgi:PAS domain S-box-containing protein